MADKLLIVAPSLNVARYYIGKVGLRMSDCKILVNSRDETYTRGLRKANCIILNSYECDDELLHLVLLRSKIAEFNLEYQNV